MTEMVDAEDLGQHVGRLVAFHRGRWYELLAVGPVTDGEVTVTVPAPRFNVLQHPIPPGETMTMQVFADDDYPVMDAPTDPAERQRLLAHGHHLVRAPEDTDDDPHGPKSRRVEWHGRGKAVDLPLPLPRSVVEFLDVRRSERGARRDNHWAFPDDNQSRPQPPDGGTP